MIEWPWHMREAFTLDTLKGTVKSIIYRNAENGYSVIEVTDDNGDERTVVGPLPLITIGERAEFIYQVAYYKPFRFLIKNF